jgi:ferritin-like protein
MAKVTNLEYNTEYYFTLTAYVTDGYESGYSNIISLYNGQWEDANCNSLDTGLSGGGGGSGGG